MKYSQLNQFDDQEFLHHVVNLFSNLERIVPSQIWIIKDLHSIHQYVSTSFSHLINVTDNTIIGSKRIADAFSEKLITKIILEEDELIIRRRQTIYTLKVYHLKKDKFFPCICIKQPLINPKTNHVVGIICQLIEISLTNLSQQIFKLHVKNNDDKKYDNIHLSKREKEVIFFFMHNLSSQQIAEILSIIECKALRKSTIDSLFLDQLYPKFNVYNRQGLANKLQQLGYSMLLPESLLTENSIMLNKVSIY